MPLALLWFGLGTNSLLFVLVHSVLWSLALNAYTGFVTAPPTLVRVGQNLGLSGFGLVSGILLPAAFPYLLTGAEDRLGVRLADGHRGRAGLRRLRRARRAELVHLPQPLRPEHP